jgi:hypothetical protein
MKVGLRMVALEEMKAVLGATVIWVAAEVAVAVAKTPVRECF